jgi:secondary thiamine-phosphate synthase enzyme
MIMQRSIQFQTAGHGEVHDLTLYVKEIVRDSGARAGLVHVFNIGSTAGIGTIECEQGLQRDLPQMLDRLVPEGRAYGHEQTWHDGNSHSHLQSTLLGAGVTVPISDGTPVLGAFQQIVHVECDIKPRQRNVVVMVMGE